MFFAGAGASGRRGRHRVLSRSSHPRVQKSSRGRQPQDPAMVRSQLGSYANSIVGHDAAPLSRLAIFEIVITGDKGVLGGSLQIQHELVISRENMRTNRETLFVP